MVVCFSGIVVATEGWEFTTVAWVGGICLLGSPVAAAYTFCTVRDRATLRLSAPLLSCVCACRCDLSRLCQAASLHLGACFKSI